MSTPFTSRARTALDDARLGRALQRMSTQLGARREAAFTSLENADRVRHHARQAKFAALRDLAASLEQFEARLIANGADVHWAEDAAQANAVIVDIARRRNVRLVAKGKSMASEETHLNEALANAGFEVVETDLGEYIVQLADDRPSHIVAPIIHLSRADVGKVMHERLQVPLSEDPAILGRYARDRLRQVFLDADMGITGANFGIAETGTICVVSNEGNGRMVTTLPRIHVVIMGIEKLIPTLADLDAFLKLLARSATGQKLTAYTSLVAGPRRAGEETGPDELHVVLLDNGRTSVMASDSAEILGCIRCGACMNVCPVYTSIGGHAYGDTYPGPVGAVVTPGLRGLAGWSELAGASSLCGACRDVCPVGLDIPRMLLQLRAASHHTSPVWLRWAMRAFGAVAARPSAFRRTAALVRGLLRRRATGGWIVRAPGPAAAWTHARDLRSPASESFQEQWERERG